MEELLKSLTGKQIDIFCGAGVSLLGDLAKVENCILHLKDDDGQICYVAVDKVIAVWEKRDKERLTGFLSKS